MIRLLPCKPGPHLRELYRHEQLHLERLNEASTHWV